MFAIPLGLYHTGSECTGISPILLVCVTPALQWTRRYFPPGVPIIFERYFLLMNALHVDWLSRMNHFSSITASATAARMVSPTCIILALPLFVLLLIGSLCGTSCVEVWQNISPVDGVSPHSFLGYPIMRLHKASLTFANAFCSPPPGGLLGDFSCFGFMDASESYLSLV